MADLKKNEIKNSSVLSVRICVIGIKPMSFQPFSIQYYNSEMTYAFYIHFSWHFGMFYINLQQKWQRIYISSAVAMGLMSNKEIKDFTIKLEEGLRIAERRMLEEKALRDEDLIVSSDGKTIERIPARKYLLQ